MFIVNCDGHFWPKSTVIIGYFLGKLSFKLDSDGRLPWNSTNYFVCLLKEINMHNTNKIMQQVFRNQIHESCFIQNIESGKASFVLFLVSCGICSQSAQYNSGARGGEWRVPRTAELLTGEMEMGADAGRTGLNLNQQLRDEGMRSNNSHYLRFLNFIAWYSTRFCPSSFLSSSRSIPVDDNEVEYLEYV